ECWIELFEQPDEKLLPGGLIQWKARLLFWEPNAWKTFKETKPTSIKVFQSVKTDLSNLSHQFLYWTRITCRWTC
ncbi:hypothetical protein ATANTOWER_005051, partial [Ataeniobius toweri]|nr:hypothetical protein [Ataeniobius toweri]